MEVADYMSMEGESGRYLEDVYSAEPVSVKRCLMSAMFWLWLRLLAFCFGISCASGFRYVRWQGDVGGTWYWNRYPGIACDVESYSYFPLLKK